MPNNTLINLRKNKGLSQAVAAKKIGISQSMLAMLEAGYRKGSDETKVMIANYYGESGTVPCQVYTLNNKN